MAEYKVTYMNGGGDTSQRDANFENDNDAIRFAEYYNSVNQHARVSKITKVVAEMSDNDKYTFLESQNYNIAETKTEKFSYDASVDGLIGGFTVVIPYLPLNMSDAKKKALVGYMRGFRKLCEGIIQHSKRFT